MASTPYLCLSGAPAGIDWYRNAFGAEEAARVEDTDGRIGHAELHIQDAVIFVSDEYPDIGVVSPTRLGGASSTVHLEVSNVDGVFAAAVEAGARPLRAPADQAHGARQATLVDPFGHRWMLSQPLDAPTENAGRISGAEAADKSETRGIVIERGPRSGQRYIDGLWSVMSYADPDAGIRFVTETLGFEELVLVRDASGTIRHSEFRWPEGGIVQIAPESPDNVFVPPAGQGSLYVVTQDPDAVWERCQTAGVEVIRPPESPPYDPDGMVFSIRDPEGNAWSFGSYAGGATE